MLGFHPNLRAEVHMKVAITLVLSLCVMMGCGQNSSPEPIADAATPRARDYGDIKNYHACKAEPRRVLSEADKCAIELLSASCTPEADCLMTCESSPDGYKVGGGCHHICFGPIKIGRAHV